MTVNRPTHVKGFTLVEILIVVVILGVLAAIVIPQFTNATDSSKASSLSSQLQTIRGQIELYYSQHQNVYPTLVQLQANWGVMTAKTDSAGNIGATNPYGPYLQQAPNNPFESSSTVAAAAATGVGWVYDESTGSVKASVPSAKATTLNISTNDASTY